MTIAFHLLGFLAFLIINYILYSVACYIDHRFDLGIACKIGSCDPGITGDPNPMNPITVLFFGFIPIIGVMLIVVVYLLRFLYLKLVDVLSMHKTLAEVGKKHRQQANDPDYQAEKYLLGKK